MPKQEKKRPKPSQQPEEAEAEAAAAAAAKPFTPFDYSKTDLKMFAGKSCFCLCRRVPCLEYRALSPKWCWFGSNSHRSEPFTTRPWLCRKGLGSSTAKWLIRKSVGKSQRCLSPHKFRKELGGGGDQILFSTSWVPISPSCWSALWNLVVR